MEDERQPEEEAPVLEPLTDDENPLVFTLTSRSIELITYLNSDEVAGFSAEQKDAFYYLGMVFGFANTSRWFHPRVLDPCSQVLETIQNSGLIFSRISAFKRIYEQSAVPSQWLVSKTIPVVDS